MNYSPVQLNHMMILIADTYKKTGAPNHVILAMDDAVELAKMQVPQSPGIKLNGKIALYICPRCSNTLIGRKRGFAVFVARRGKWRNEDGK